MDQIMRTLIYKIKDILKNLKWKIQKIFRGYSDIEMWNLDDTISKWIVPKLKIFKSITQGSPAYLDSFEEWQNMLDEMIFGFEWPTKELEWYNKNVFYLTGDAKEEKFKEFEALKERALKGRILFAEHFYGLWW